MRLLECVAISLVIALAVLTSILALNAILRSIEGRCIVIASCVYSTNSSSLIVVESATNSTCVIDSITVKLCNGSRETIRVNASIRPGDSEVIQVSDCIERVLYVSSHRVKQ